MQKSYEGQKEGEKKGERGMEEKSQIASLRS